MNDSNKEYRSRLSKNGLITLATATIILVALILVNVGINALPADVRGVDLTENKMYSVTNDTKRVLAKNESAVNIYLICQGGEAGLADKGIHLDAFLKNVAAVNKKISYELIDPTVKTDFLGKFDFGSDSIANLSVIVESALRSRLLHVTDFFTYYVDGVGKVDQNTALYYYYYYNLSPSSVFDGEALVLGAISYVTNPNLPTVYELSGHSETALTTTLTDLLDSENIKTSTVSLTALSSVPADCNMLVINAPQTDLTDNETVLLQKYLNAGGTVMLVSTPDSAGFSNLAKITASMGLSAKPGIVVETDSNHYYNAQTPYYLIPKAGTHAITEMGSQVMLPFAHGINIADGANVAPLFMTSSNAYAIPIDATTLQMPEGGTPETIYVGVISENGNGGKFVWIASNGFTTDSMNQAVNGGNYAIFSACTNWICGENNSATADFLPLSTATLSVSPSTAGLLAIMLIFVLPLSFIGYGLFCVIRRKKR